jgi:M6 family metalloprotease-like protein
MLLLVANSKLLAVPAYPYPINYRLPDGTEITIQLHGDEFLSWASSPDGYTLLINSVGYYEYAIEDNNGDLVPSGVRANNEIERTVEETYFLQQTPKELNFSTDQISMIQQIRDVRDNALRSQQSTTISGTVHAPIILVEFPGKPFTRTSAEFQNLINQVNYSVGTATGSVHDYFLATSYGQLDFQVDVFGPYTLAHSIGYYDNKTNGNSNQTIEMIIEATNFADAAGCNFSNYDSNGDNIVDGIHLIYAGYDQSAGGTPGDAIWASAWSGYTFCVRDGKGINRFSMSSELRNTSGTTITPIGVIAHELSHVFGLPDLYDTDYASSGGQSIHLDQWDIMASGSWNNNGDTPPYHSAWCRDFLGWVPAIELTAPVDITLPNPVAQGTCYKINTTTPNEYFLVENRQQQNWDAYIPSSGMLIYHVDENAGTSHNSTMWRDININPAHRGLYVKQAGGGAGSNSSTRTNDPYPYNSNNSFTDTSVPNSQSWNGNSTGKPVTDIAHNTSTKTVSFKFMGGASATCPLPEILPATNITENSADISWTAGGSENQWYISYKAQLVANWEPEISVTTTPNYQITGLNAGTNYNVRVRSFCGESDYSIYGAVSFTTIGIPVATEATDVASTFFTANWNPAAGSTNYLLSVYFKNGSTPVYNTNGGFTDLPVGNITSYNVTGLDRTVSTEWYYTIKSVPASGSVTSASNEIAVQLAEYDPVICNYMTNIQDGDSPTNYNGFSGGRFFGHGGGENKYEQFAEYYNLSEEKKISGFRLFTTASTNNSGSSDYAKITMKIWSKGSNGLPANELYSEYFSINSFAPYSENSFSFVNPISLSGEFFIGFEIYYAPENPDIFGVYSTHQNASGNRNNTAYIYHNNSWSNTGIGNMALYIFPNVCTLPTVTEWKQTTASTNWNDANNWTNDVPAPITNVTIPKSDSYPIVPTAGTTINTITIQAGAEIGRQDLLNYDKAFVQYDFGNLNSRNRWNMLSIPLQEAFPGDFTFGGYPSTWIRKFTVDEDDGNAGWGITVWQNTVPFHAGDGFIIWLDDEDKAIGSENKGLQRSNGILELPFDDNPSVHPDVHYNYAPASNTFSNWNTSHIIIPEQFYSVSRTTNAYKLAGASITEPLKFGYDDDYESDFTLVGNPFMASLDFNALQSASENATKIKDNYQVWTGKDASAAYVGYHTDGAFGAVTIAETAGQYIAPMQAFIVEKVETGYTSGNLVFDISITNNITNKAILKSATSDVDKLNIVAQNEVAAVQTFIANREGGEDTFGNRDARKLLNGITNIPEIYTLKPKDQNQVAVGANIINNDNLLIPVGLATSYSGKITLTFTGMDTYQAKISLLDVEAKVEKDLTDLASFEYSFDYAGQSTPCEDRFFIRLAPANVTGLGNDAARHVSTTTVSGKDGIIQVVSGASDLIKQISVFNVQGALLQNYTTNSAYYTIPQKWISGVYIVKVVSEKGTQNVKLIIK